MLLSDVIFYPTKNDLKCTFMHYKNSIAIGYEAKYFSSFLCLTKDKEKELGHNVNYLNCKNKLWLRNARHFFVVNVRLVSLYIAILYRYYIISIVIFIHKIVLWIETNYLQNQMNDRKSYCPIDIAWRRQLRRPKLCYWWGTLMQIYITIEMLKAIESDKTRLDCALQSITFALFHLNTHLKKQDMAINSEWK